MSNNTTIFLYVQDMYPIYKVWLLSSNLLMLAFLFPIVLLISLGIWLSISNLYMCTFLSSIDLLIILGIWLSICNLLMCTFLSSIRFISLGNFAYILETSWDGESGGCGNHCWNFLAHRSCMFCMIYYAVKISNNDSCNLSIYWNKHEMNFIPNKHEL